MTCRLTARPLAVHAARLLPQLPDGFALCVSCAALLTRNDLATRCPGPSPTALAVVAEILARGTCCLCAGKSVDPVCARCAEAVA